MSASYLIIPLDATLAVKRIRRKPPGFNNLGAGRPWLPTRRSNHSGKVRRGLAAREAVVILLVVGSLLLLAAPWLLSRREMSRRVLCERRLAKTAEALQLFDNATGALPGYANFQAVDAQGQKQPTGWLFPTLPLLDARAADDDGRPAEDPPWLTVFVQYGPQGPEATRGMPPDVRIPMVVCPADPTLDLGRSTMCSWAVNCGRPDRPKEPADWPGNGVFQNRWRPSSDFRPSMKYLNEHDGAEYTLLLIEKTEGQRWTDNLESLQGVVWTEELDGQQPPWGQGLWRVNQQTGQSDGGMKYARPSSGHAGGVNSAFADGHVQFLNEAIDYVALINQLTSNINDVHGENGELLGPPFGVTER